MFKRITVSEFYWQDEFRYHLLKENHKSRLDFFVFKHDTVVDCDKDYYSCTSTKMPRFYQALPMSVMHRHILVYYYTEGGFYKTSLFKKMTQYLDIYMKAVDTYTSPEDKIKVGKCYSIINERSGNPVHWGSVLDMEHASCDFDEEKVKEISMINSSKARYMW